MHLNSSYQIQFAAKDIYTPGDTPDVLVCFNPAALKVNMGTVNKGGIIVVNEDEFIEKNLLLLQTEYTYTTDWPTRVMSIGQHL